MIRDSRKICGVYSFQNFVSYNGYLYYKFDIVKKASETKKL